MKKAGLLFGGVILLLAVSVSGQENYDTSKLFFEHWKHYDSQGIPCLECHIKLTDGAFLLPGHEVCRTCHPEGKIDDYTTAEKKTCGKCHPKDDSMSIPLLSKNVRRTERIFYHSKNLMNLCEVCHRKMLEDMAPLGLIKSSADERHRIRRKAHLFYAYKKCESCHQDMTMSKAPQNHNDPQWAQVSHKDIAPEFNCRICHTKTFCQDCHIDSY